MGDEKYVLKGRDEDLRMIAHEFGRGKLHFSANKSSTIISLVNFVDTHQEG